MTIPHSDCTDIKKKNLCMITILKHTISFKKQYHSNDHTDTWNKLKGYLSIQNTSLPSCVDK